MPRLSSAALLLINTWSLLFVRSQDLKGWRKYENFKLLRGLYPANEEPQSFVFVGDTGELDKEAGMRMLTSKSSAHKVKAVFLHVVSERVSVSLVLAIILELRCLVLFLVVFISISRLTADFRHAFSAVI